MSDALTQRPLFLDFAATTPVDPEVADAVCFYMREEFGNAGSRTHEYGARAKRALEMARRQIAAVVDAQVQEVVFTSGATESNNLAILGLLDYGLRTGKTHLITTTIEHKSVLEPFRRAEERGFRVTRIPADSGGRVQATDIQDAIEDQTLMVSVMHANNETGIVQPIEQIAELAKDRGFFLHVDAAQTFAKKLGPLRNKHIDLISCSGHKLYAPKGIGALIIRRIGVLRDKLTPLMFGGDQESGIRPGTVPVQLAVGMGLSAERLSNNTQEWEAACLSKKAIITDSFGKLGYTTVGNGSDSLENIVCMTNNGSIDSETFFVLVKNIVAVSNGSACTSQSHTQSHVLTSMGLSLEAISSAIRISWSPETDLNCIPDVIGKLEMLCD